MERKKKTQINYFVISNILPHQSNYNTFNKNALLIVLNNLKCTFFNINTIKCLRKYQTGIFATFNSWCLSMFVTTLRLERNLF